MLPKNLKYILHFQSNFNKNRLSSTTCGKELQKIGKVSNDFVKKGPKNHQFKAICVFDLFWPLNDLKT